MALAAFIVISWQGIHLAESNRDLETSNHALQLKTSEAERNAKEAEAYAILASKNEASATRVNRGGSFSNTAIFSRSANRNSYPPGYADINLGLRPARAPSE